MYTKEWLITKATDIILFYLMTGIHKCLNIKLLFNQDQKFHGIYNLYGLKIDLARKTFDIGLPKQYSIKK